MEYRFNSFGKVRERIDQMGYVETFQYDECGNLSLYTDRNGNQVRRIYNVFGNPVYEKATDKNGENAVITTYGYDSLGRLTHAVCDGYSYEYYYNEQGLLKDVYKRQVHASDFTRYQVLSQRLLRLFDTIEVNSLPFTVYSYVYDFSNQEMTGIYGLQMAQGLLVPTVYPMHLIGVALTGTVVNVSGTAVQVALEIDKVSGNPAAFWFPYSTISASPNGSGSVSYTHLDVYKRQIWNNMLFIWIATL